MKKKLINFIPIIGIYFCFKYWFRPGKRTAMEFFDSEYMAIYHFFTPLMLLLIFQILTHKI